MGIPMGIGGSTCRSKRARELLTEPQFVVKNCIEDKYLLTELSKGEFCGTETRTNLLTLSSWSRTEGCFRVLPVNNILEFVV
jgi:hypothetical protein